MAGMFVNLMLGMVAADSFDCFGCDARLYESPATMPLVASVIDGGVILEVTEPAARASDCGGSASTMVVCCHLSLSPPVDGYTIVSEPGPVPVR